MFSSVSYAENSLAGVKHRGGQRDKFPVLVFGSEFISFGDVTSLSWDVSSGSGEYSVGGAHTVSLNVEMPLVLPEGATSTYAPENLLSPGMKKLSILCTEAEFPTAFNSLGMIMYVDNSSVESNEFSISFTAYSASYWLDKDGLSGIAKGADGLYDLLTIASEIEDRLVDPDTPDYMKNHLLGEDYYYDSPSVDTTPTDSAYGKKKMNEAAPRDGDSLIVQVSQLAALQLGNISYNDWSIISSKPLGVQGILDTGLSIDSSNYVQGSFVNGVKAPVKYTGVSTTITVGGEERVLTSMYNDEDGVVFNFDGRIFGGGEFDAGDTQAVARVQQDLDAIVENAGSMGRLGLSIEPYSVTIFGGEFFEPLDAFALTDTAGVVHNLVVGAVHVDYIGGGRFKTTLSMSASDTGMTNGEGVDAQSGTAESISRRVDALEIDIEKVRNSYLPLSGGTVNGMLTVKNELAVEGKSGKLDLWVNDTADNGNKGLYAYKPNGEYAEIIKVDQNNRINGLGEIQTNPVLYGGSAPKFIFKSEGVDSTASTAAVNYYRDFAFFDKNDLWTGWLENVQNVSGTIATQIGARNASTGANIDNTLTLGVYADGSRYVSVSAQKPWTDALGIAAKVEASHFDATWGEWCWLKWSDGNAMCWKYGYGSYTINAAWGSIYSQQGSIGRQRYPFDFTWSPGFTLMMVNGGSKDVWVSYHYDGTNQYTPTCYLTSPTAISTAAGYNMIFFAWGRWK